jgi:hypothetical protein
MEGERRGYRQKEWDTEGLFLDIMIWIWDKFRSLNISTVEADIM